MRLRDLLLGLVRRWPLTVAVLAVTVGFGMLAFRSVGPSYTDTASVLLFPPTNTAEPGSNPFMSLGSLDQANDALARSLSSSQTREMLEDKGFAGDYTVENDFTTDAPIMVVTVDAPTTGEASELLEAVVDQIPISLRDLQIDLGIDREHQITSIVLAPGGEPTLNTRTQLRAVILVAGVCLAAGLMFVGLVDGLLLRRKARRLGEQQTSAPQPLAEIESEPAEVAPPPASAPEQLPAARSSSLNGDREVAPDTKSGKPGRPGSSNSVDRAPSLRGKGRRPPPIVGRPKARGRK